MSMLGAVLAAGHHWQEAEPYLVKAYEGVVEKSTDVFDVEVLQTLGLRVVEFYKSTGQSAKAAQWRQRVEADILRLKATTPK